jgi:predicted transcriptional regulator
MAMTVRLPDELARRGRRYAAELGVSLNALLAIALREYLDARDPTPRVLTRSSALAQAIARQVQAGPVRRRR